MRKLRKEIENFPKYYSISKWLLRMVSLIYIFLTFLPNILYFELSSISFYTSIAYIYIAIMLIYSGIKSSSSYTRFYGFFLSNIVFVHIIGILLVRGFDDMIPQLLLLLGIGLYFSTSSNRYDFYAIKKKYKKQHNRLWKT